MQKRRLPDQPKSTSFYAKCLQSPHHSRFCIAELYLSTHATARTVHACSQIPDYHDSVLITASANPAMTSTAKTTASIVPPLPRRTSSSLGDHQLPRPSSNASSSVSGSPRAAGSRSGDDDAPDEITAMISRDRMQRSYNTAPAVASTTTATVSGLRSPPASLGGRKRKAGRTRRFSTASAPPTSRTDIGASPGRWRRFKEKYGSIELDNKGSVARDHLSLGTCEMRRLTWPICRISIG